MPLHLYYSISYLYIRKEICGDQFSTLIVHVRVLHAVGTSGGYVEGLGKKNLAFGWNHFFSIKNRSPPPFVKPLELASGTSVRNTVGLILVRKGFNYFIFYSIDKYEIIDRTD
jgi:hypothetical protein